MGHMMRISRLATVFLATGVLVASFPTRLNAMFAALSDRELIDTSALIVQAEFLGQTDVQFGPSGGSMSVGVLMVQEALKGGLQGKIVLLALPSSAKPVSSSDLLYRPGQTGLWFLRLPSDVPKGLYLADHPQRFISSASGHAKIDSFKLLLREQK